MSKFQLVVAVFLVLAVIAFAVVQLRLRSVRVVTRNRVHERGASPIGIAQALPGNQSFDARSGAVAGDHCVFESFG